MIVEKEFTTTMNERFLLQEEYLGEGKLVNEVMPLVSVCVPTYCHKHFISACLDGILKQETSFPIEVIVGDDGSLDGTAEICKQYAESNQDRMRLFLRDRRLSQYINSKGETHRFNGHWCRMSARGKYIAMCEGDDYWTDCHKLQRQIDFLETHPDYSICFHNALNLFVDGRMEPFSHIEDRDYSIEDIMSSWIIPTASVVIKRDIIISDFYTNIICNAELLFGDTPMFLTCLKFGKARGFSDTMSIYRRHEGGISSYFTNEKYFALIEYCKSLGILFGLQHLADFAVVRNCVDGFFHSIKTKEEPIVWGFLAKGIKTNPKYAISLIVGRVMNFFKRK